MQRVDTTRVVDLLKKRHIKKGDLAKPLGTTKQNVSFKLNGSVKMTVPELKILCDYLEINTGEVFDYFKVVDD